MSLMLDKPVALPEVATWTLRNVKTQEVRTFEQSELTIDGEVRLIQLANETIRILNEKGFPWDEVGNVVAEDGTWDWPKVSELLTLVITEIPEFVAESTAILFSLSPFDDEGRRNRDYERDKLFIRNSISFPRWIEIVQKFTEQNDYERLARPFGLALTRAMDMGSRVLPRSSIISSEESTSSSQPDTDETEETSQDA